MATRFGLSQAFAGRRQVHLTYLIHCILVLFGLTTTRIHVAGVHQADGAVKAYHHTRRRASGTCHQSRQAAFVSFPVPFASQNQRRQNKAQQEAVPIGKGKACRITRSRHHRGVISGKHKLTTCWLRNFDLPEAVVFYGTDVLLEQTINQEGEVEGEGNTYTYQFQKGVRRVLDEACETGTAIVWLSEAHSVAEMQKILTSSQDKDLSDGLQLDMRPHSDGEDSGMTTSSDGRPKLYLRSSLNLPLQSWQSNPLNEQEEDQQLSSTYPIDERIGLCHSPSPAALLDTLSSITIHPQGFGGSSGFGSKQADPPRSPIAMHTVVFVSHASGSDVALKRGLSARVVGTRLILIEGEERQLDQKVEDVVDGVVESLGEEGVDWDVITLDSISTPGSFWLNPPHPR
jgi:hypothetical protein